MILAGGRSQRFGRDKLRAPLDGVPWLHHVVRAAAAVADEIVLVLSHAGPAPDLAGLRLEVPLRPVRDLLSQAGPLAGAYTGLSAATGERVLLLAGDAPWVPAPLLRALIDEAQRRIPGVALAWDGMTWPMPAVLPRERTRLAAEQLLVDGERRLRSLLDAAGVVPLAEAFWSPLDPEGRWSLDVDVPEDLPLP